MRPITDIKNKVLAAVLTIAALVAGQSAWAASLFAVTNSGTTFTVTRTGNTGVAETVNYRTVSLSAIEGQHFTAAYGVLTFAANDTSKTVTVNERTPVTAAYKYQNGTSRSYRFEVLDCDGSILASCDRSLSTGTTFQFSNEKVNNTITNNMVYLNGNPPAVFGIVNKVLNVYYTPPASQVETSGTLNGFVPIDDSYDYSQKAATVSTDAIVSSTGAPRDYLQLAGYKIYATACFTMKEKDDGYYYVQILEGDGSATYDGADPDGAVNDPDNSIYKACFELKKGSGAYEGEGKMYYPHRYDYTDRASSGQNIVWTEFPLAESYLWQQKFKSGYRDENAGSVVLGADVTHVTTRFDCAGGGDDTWGYKDFFVSMTLCESTAPQVLKNYKVSGGRHQKGATIYVSVPFKEIVTVTETPTLTTSWGTLSYTAGSGTNVLTFKGEISSDATGTLSITGCSGTIKDLAGNSFNGTINRDLGTILDDDYQWSLSDFVQLEANTYEIANKVDLHHLACYVNNGQNDCSGITFRQTQDITCDDTYTPIGCLVGQNVYAKFCGTYDGQGHTVSGITVTSDKDYAGLFGIVGEGGTVQNVVLANCTFFTNRNHVGGIAGDNCGIVKNCRVENTVTITSISNRDDYGGIVGRCGMVIGCISAATVNGNNQGDDYGGIAGTLSNGIIQDCLYTGTTVNAKQHKGSIVGEKFMGNIINNYYTAIDLGGMNGYDINGARRARTVTLGEGVTLSGDETAYNVSGLTAIGTGNYALRMDSTIYSGAGQTLTLDYTGEVPEGYSLIYSVNGTPIEGNTFTMPDADVDVEVTVVLAALLPGDINGDNVVDVSDVNIIINIILGKAQASTFPGISDLNNDNIVDVSDVNAVINIILGKIN